MEPGLWKCILTWAALVALAGDLSAQDERKGREQAPSADVEKERAQFRLLLATNPDQVLSKLKPPTGNAPPIGNTLYEELTCLGYNPRLSLMEATVHIKRPSGYLSGVCHPGSVEYVRFFIDYMDGAGWQDVGTAAFRAHDIPNDVDCAKAAEKPLSYVVTHPLEPRRRPCETPLLPKLRAILSWEFIPPGPNGPIVWGNGLDRHIQIEARRLRWMDIVSPETGLTANLPAGLEFMKDDPIPFPELPAPPIAELSAMYKVPGKSEEAVEPHRFASSEIEAALGSGLLDPEAISAKAKEYKDLGFDWPSVVTSFEQLQGDTKFEELDCLGLDYNLERLVATFRIKRGLGYSGNLCKGGSKEHRR